MNQELVEHKLLRLCQQPRTFEFIVKNLDGLDPIQAIGIMNLLKDDNKLELRNDLWAVVDPPKSLMLDVLTPDPELYLKKYMGYFDFLKTPHPLDFEWRNSSESLKYLLDKVTELNTIKDKILILGMPTLFATGCLKDIPHHLTLVERNKPIIKGLTKLNVDKERFRIIDADIFQITPERVGKFYSVFMDPPWYTPHFKQFMWLASSCIETGGLVGISLPPINTRPNIADERLEWLNYCLELGLSIESLYAQKLQYAMPFFEFNAFRAAGIKDIFPFWRKGDFAIFRKVKSPQIERPENISMQSGWVEKEVAGIRLRINTLLAAEHDSNLSITSIIKGDILPTVSTRDERRKLANVWTSGNRIFKVSNPSHLLTILENFTIQDDKLTQEEKDIISFVKVIGDLEKKEYNNYLDWLYHEMERQIN